MNNKKNNYFDDIRLIVTNKKKFSLIIFLYVLTSILESIGIGILGPFVALLLNNNIDYPLFLNLGSLENKITIMIYLIFFIFTTKTLMMISALYVTQKFAFNMQHQLRIRLTSIYLNLNFSEYLKKNSSEYNENIQNLIAIFTSNTLVTGLKIVSDLILLFFLIILLTFTNYELVIILFATTFAFGFFYDYFFKRTLYEISQKSSESSKKIFQITGEIFKGIKEIRIYFKENFFTKKLKEASYNHYTNYLKSTIISNSPKYLLEYLIIVILLLFIYLINDYENDLVSILPTLGIFGLAALRIIPSVNSIIKSLTEFRFGKYATSVIAKDLKIGIEKKFTTKQSKEDLNFSKLEFKDVNFRYNSKDALLLNNINFEINKGDYVGIIGSSGSGKTTILNLVIGLLNPNSGQIKVNNENVENKIKEWQLNLAYLPQDVFLLDGSLKENITLEDDISKIDIEKLNNAINKSNLKSFVDSSDNGLDTTIGENGIKISGGQRQRLGIARALYSNKNFLILDESTNALDEKTKRKIIEELYSLKDYFTIIFVDHNEDYYSRCDKIFELSNGSLRIKKNEK
jgi:ATP-binding cassette, subfamily B, bacterial PglK|tara:strand:+ start:655 stop:2373 length:1719 start_codon:yes stop_codon:yes gene_type:complete